VGFGLDLDNCSALRKIGFCKRGFGITRNVLKFELSLIHAKARTLIHRNTEIKTSDIYRSSTDKSEMLFYTKERETKFRPEAEPPCAFLAPCSFNRVDQIPLSGVCRNYDDVQLSEFYNLELYSWEETEEKQKIGESSLSS
jgi:hypothetical protein